MVCTELMVKWTRINRINLIKYSRKMFLMRVTHKKSKKEKDKRKKEKLCNWQKKNKKKLIKNGLI